MTNVPNYLTDMPNHNKEMFFSACLPPSLQSCYPVSSHFEWSTIYLGLLAKRLPQFYKV